MNSTWTPARVPASTLRDRAYEAIKDGILRLELRPGAPLVESALAQRLGISKSPVRDALHQLEREGLAVREAFKGVQVAPLEREDVLGAFEIRALLEELAVRRCAAHIDAQGIARVRGIIDDGRRALEIGDAVGVEQSVDEFHRAVARLAEHPLLLQMLDNVYDRLARVRALVVQDSSRSARSLTEHEAILDGIAAGEAERAVEACRAHADRLLRDIEELLPPPGDTP